MKLSLFYWKLIDFFHLLFFSNKQIKPRHIPFNGGGHLTGSESILNML